MQGVIAHRGAFSTHEGKGVQTRRDSVQVSQKLFTTKATAPPRSRDAHISSALGQGGSLEFASATDMPEQLCAIKGCIAQRRRP